MEQRRQGEKSTLCFNLLHNGHVKFTLDVEVPRSTEKFPLVAMLTEYIVHVIFVCSFFLHFNMCNVTD